MTNIQFTDWKERHPEVVEKFQYSHGKNSRWGHLVCKWDQKKGNNRVISNIYAACMNLENGDLYLDDDRKLIWFKSVLLTIGRPLHTIFAKTLYHALGIGIGIEVFHTVRGKQDKKQCLNNCVRELKDIIRTPLYGLAMTVVNIATVILSPFHPTVTYDLRRTAGKLEKDLLWGDTDSNWILAPCFQPNANIQQIRNKYNRRVFEDTAYSNPLNPITVRITNFARAQILHLDESDRSPYVSSTYIDPDLPVNYWKTLLPC